LCLDGTPGVALRLGGPQESKRYPKRHYTNYNLPIPRHASWASTQKSLPSEKLVPSPETDFLPTGTDCCGVLATLINRDSVGQHSMISMPNKHEPAAQARDTKGRLFTRGSLARAAG